MVKDWKKFEPEFSELYIWHNKQKGVNIGIDIDDEKRIYKYRVFLDEDYDTKKIKSFKTKSQALKFVRDYMRKH